MTYDGFHSYTYDFEGRILKVDGGTATYSYNALGQRVSKVVSGTEGDFVLDQAGHAITGRISSPTHPWYLSEVYAGNMHVATYADGTTAFPHTNWLGSVMASTGPSGSTIKTCSGYLPFGDGSSCSGSDVSSLGFTGLWSDSETLLDNTPNRNYQSLAGRWTTPDPAGLAAVDVTNPQTWNRYAYVTNNPLSYVDPLGLFRAAPGQCQGGQGICPDEGAWADPTTTDGFGGNVDFSAIGGSSSDCPICTGPYGWLGTVGIQEGYFGGGMAGGAGSGSGGNQFTAAGIVYGDGTDDSPYFIYVSVFEPFGGWVNTPSHGPATQICGDFVCDKDGNQVGWAPRSVRGLSEDSNLEVALMVGPWYLARINSNPFLRIGPGYISGGQKIFPRIASGGLAWVGGGIFGTVQLGRQAGGHFD